MKKIFATALAAVMTVSLTSVAFAETEAKGFVLGYKEALLLVLVPPFMPIRMMTATTMNHSGSPGHPGGWH